MSGKQAIPMARIAFVLPDDEREALQEVLDHTHYTLTSLVLQAIRVAVPQIVLDPEKMKAPPLKAQEVRSGTLAELRAKFSGQAEADTTMILSKEEARRLREQARSGDPTPRPGKRKVSG